MFRICDVVLCVLLLQSALAEEGSTVKRCPTPEVPENARAVGNNHTVGSKVKFLCNEGFFRRGRPFKVKCQSNGQWTKSGVSCVGRSCGDPGPPVNGERIGLLFQFNNIVAFECFEGYVLVGPEKRTCLANQTWSETQPICKPITCKDPPEVVGAVIEGGGFEFKAHVHYKCREGYHIQGSTILTCGANGKWIGEPPVCKALICKDPGTPQNGSRNGSGDFSYKSKLSFQCNKGFILFGSYERSCDEDGKWTGVQPYCIECAGVNTPVFIRKGVQFSHGFVKQKNGNVVTVLTEPADEEEDVVILGPGTQHYIIVEDKVPTAKDIFIETRVIAKHAKNGKYTFAKVLEIVDGQYMVTFEDERRTIAMLWIDSIRLLDPPRFCATCPDPGWPTRGFREDSLEEFISGTEVEYACEINTELIGSSKQKCLPDGIWTGEQPTCRITSCWELDVFPPKNGQRTGNDFGIGSSVTFSCDQGHELIGNSSSTCQADGQWSVNVPICKDLCEKKQCQSWEKCVYDNNINNTKCVCREDLDCPGDFQPICGSNAKKYNNDCIMKATACREGRSIEKVANGSCSPGAICQIKPTSFCRAYFRNFYFNLKTKKCEEIIAGGCHPSGWNGFTTMEECNSTCLVDVCAQPVEPGPCDKSVSRWAFNAKAGRCKRFNYGGCSGNENNFETKGKCNQRCPSTVPARAKDACPECSHTKLREACKESAFVFVGKVESKLPEDSTKKQVRYLVAVSRVLRNTNDSISLGTRLVIRVPYDKTPTCPCPSLPKVTFILMGNGVIETTEGNPHLNVVITQPAFVQRWNKDFPAKLETKCAQYFDVEEAN